jgi:hypothetical protein
MEPEEGARFDAQLRNEQHKILEIGRRVIALQAFSIGNPDAVPKRQYQKKKTHGKADARGLTGAEVTGKELKVREAFETREAIESRATTTEQDSDQVLVANTPPRPIGESQGGTSISLALRTPERIHRAPPPAQARPTYSAILGVGPYMPLASTAPLMLSGTEGLGKRKRAYT